MKILHVSPSFFPATKWGGPIFSTKAICDWVSENSDCEIEVLTSDAAGPDRSDNLQLSTRTQQFPAGYKVCYFKRIAGHSIAPGLLWKLPGAIRRTDIVHLTSVYSFTTLPTLILAKLFGKPVIWSPRGAIQASAEWTDAPRRKVKRAFEILAQLCSPSDTTFHVTARSEEVATSGRMPSPRVAMIPNGVPLPLEKALGTRKPNTGPQIRLMFLSRIHPKKGLRILLDAMAKLDDDVLLDIYGTGDAEHLEELAEQTQNLGLQERVKFRGHVDNEAKTNAFLNADLFVLPSHNENFGIVIAEALAHQVPVLTTTHTPWKDLNSRGCGLCLELSSDTIAEGIRDLRMRDFNDMGSRGRAWIAEVFSLQQTGSQMLQLYRETSDRHERGHS